jgi:hypothetical protein
MIDDEKQTREYANRKGEESKQISCELAAIDAQNRAGLAVGA